MVDASIKIKDEKANDGTEANENQNTDKIGFLATAKWFISKALFAYLPLCFYWIVNVPYFQGAKDGEFMKGLFLALSYVFIAQLNVHVLDKFWHSLKIFCAIVCLALYTTDKFDPHWLCFVILLLVSALAIFCSNRENGLKPNKLSNEVSL